MKRRVLIAVCAALAVTTLPADADVVRQTANDVPVLQRPPDGPVKGYGYRRQLVDVSNCFPVGEPLGGDGLWALHTNLSTGIQGYAQDYYLGGRCGR